MRMTDDAIVQALIRRIDAVCDIPRGASHGDDLAAALARLAEVVQTSPDAQWRAYVAVTTKYPSEQDLANFSELLQTSGAPAAIEYLLDINAKSAEPWAQSADAEIVDRLCLDVTNTAKWTFHTGIQKVVRELVPRWVREHDVALIVWDEDAHTFRNPNADELDLIFMLNHSRQPAEQSKRIIIPANTMVFMPEVVTQPTRANALECLATHSNNSLGLIIHDVLPLTMPEVFKERTRAGFTDALRLIRSASLVSTVSESGKVDVDALVTCFELDGFTSTRVCANPLPHELPTATTNADLPGIDPQLPMVLTVSSIEPRKNHEITLQAAEILWNEGAQFQLVFIGWRTWFSGHLLKEIDRLSAAGKPVHLIREATDDQLATAYRHARFTVFISLGEGFGLPIAESFAAGTPAVVSNFGPMAEQAATGGADLVNPRDLAAVTAAIRKLLIDDQHLHTLEQQLTTRPQRTWDTYANTLWHHLTTNV